MKTKVRSLLQQWGNKKTSPDQCKNKLHEILLLHQFRLAVFID